MDAQDIAGIDLDALFDPVTLAGLSFPNRIAMSPMTREFATDGVLPPESAPYYAARARGGAGLIITEATTVDHMVAHYSTREPYMFGAAALERWRDVVEAVHAEGSLIFPQIWHTGLSRRRRHTHNPDEPSIAASAVSSAELALKAGDEALPNRRSGTLPRPATEEDLEAVIVAFGEAAAQAQALGFDGIAIHGAHGYLIYQFLWDRSNRRDDRWGGSMANRSRLAIEIVREVRRRTGPDFPIMFRFSQWSGWDYQARLAETPRALEDFLTPLAEAGVDIFDASTRRFWQPAFEGSDLNLAGWAKKLTGRPVLTVGSVGLEAPLGDEGDASVAPALANLARLAQMLARGEFDLVGVGRALLADPDWPAKVRAHRWGDLLPYDKEAAERAL